MIRSRSRSRSRSQLLCGKYGKPNYICKLNYTLRRNNPACVVIFWIFIGICSMYVLNDVILSRTCFKSVGGVIDGIWKAIKAILCCFCNHCDATVTRRPATTTTTTVTNENFNRQPSGEIDPDLLEYYVFSQTFPESRRPLLPAPQQQAVPVPVPVPAPFSPDDPPPTYTSVTTSHHAQLLHEQQMQEQLLRDQVEINQHQAIIQQRLIDQQNRLQQQQQAQVQSNANRPAHGPFAGSRVAFSQLRRGSDACVAEPKQPREKA